MKLEETFNPATSQNSICPDITAQWKLSQVNQKDQVILQEKNGNRCYQFSLVEGYALQHFIGKFTVEQVQNLCKQRFGNIDHSLVLQLLKKLLILNILDNPKAVATPKLKSSIQWTYNPEGYWILDNPEDKASSPMQVGEADKAVIDDLGQSPQEICAKNSIPPQHLQQLLSMLAGTGMLEGTDQAVPKGHKFNPLQLLFFRLPLVNPDPWLDQHIDKLRWIWTQQFSFFLIIFIAASVVVGLSKQSLIIFTGQTIWHNYGLSVLIPFILLCGLVVAIHELSHAFTLKHYGGTVPEIGLLMICLMPGCYTDTTASYRLIKRRQRVLVVGAGVLCQVILWAIGLWLWLLLAETSWLKNISYLLMVAALLTVVINLNPLARFDGYYLASALSGINNLRDRSFQFYANLFRRLPLTKESNKRCILATYAPFSLLYSLLVFGHLLLWLTGWSLTNIPFWTLLLISLWVIYFYSPSMTTTQPDNRSSLKVVAPTLKPATAKQQEVKSISWKPKIIIGLSIIGLGVLSLLPVPDKVSGPAVVEPMPYQYQSVSVPEQATVEKIYVRNNDVVRRGDKLVTFSQRELTRTLQDVESKLREAQSRRDAALQQKLVADSKLNKATINEQSTRQNVTRLEQKMAQMVTGENSLVRQLKLQQEIKNQQIAELKSNLANLENQIKLGQKAADAQAISTKQWDELIQKRINIQTQITTATMEIQGIAAQIAQAKERIQEELLNQRLPEANDKIKEVEISSQEVKAAEAQIQQLQSLVGYWQAEQKKLSNQQTNLTLFAKHDGIVNAIGLETNEHRKVPEGQELLKIVDFKYLSATVEVSPEEARRVKVELPVTFRPDADFQGYWAKVIDIPPAVVSSASNQAPQQPKVKVRILFDQPDQGLILGATGNAHIQISQIRVYQHLQREFLKLFNPGRFF